MWTQSPIEGSDGKARVIYQDGREAALVGHDDADPEQVLADAETIIKACNLHERLLKLVTDAE